MSQPGMMKNLMLHGLNRGIGQVGSVKTVKYGLNMAIIEYKQSFYIGRNNTQLLPPILIIPVLIKNPNNDSVIAKGKENKTYSLHLADSKKLDDEENDIDVSFRQSLNRGMGFNNKSKENNQTTIDLKLSEPKIENKTDLVNSTEKVTIQNIDARENMTGAIESTTPSDGIYPASNNSKQYINSISLTMTSPDASLPPINDNRWQNFTVSTDLNFINESSTQEPDASTSSGPYSAALYNNRMIDQISITTNSYTNEESPPQSPKNDRWRTFSEKPEYSANQFKPLAGLYYDGFLHKPLIMLPGFIPRNYYNL